ncbi:type I restriction enzyme, S subunit [Vreelandella subterranea]|uniref:Type I restriction enzyme, S subunit n=1 Tax=Vreelandella subterranea TaxID=416874 RepID=A0A1H9U4W8_9GAMM|nr:restriction endonuclease subunit S [Halomonas subterranea]SES04610.1 type I restriction enzyme, S subunit [Halomonas subterranea]
MNSETVEVREVSPGYGFTAEKPTEPFGYKQTEVGVIPEDWSVLTVGVLNPFVTSGSRGWAQYYSKFGDLFVRITNMSRENVHLDLTDTRFVSVPNIGQEGDRTSLARGDLLISITADIGIIGYIDESVPLPAYINQHIALVRFPSEIVCSKFVALFLAFGEGQKRFHAITDQGAKAGINLKTVRELPLALPPTLKEQRAIATALSDVDALLEELDRLIAKKHDIKQATMQQLLTGQTRLPGFEGEWEEAQLGELCSFHKGKGLPKSSLDAYGRYECIHYGELFTQYGVEIRKTISRTSTRGDKFLSVANDVLMPTSDVTPSGLAKASCIKSDKVVLGGDILVIRADPHTLNGTFLSYIIRNDDDQVLRLVTGTTVYHLYGSDMRKFTLRIPGVREQNEIVKALLAMGDEVEAIKQRRAKTVVLKQSMMQELLTGRTRLKVAEQNSEFLC